MTKEEREYKHKVKMAAKARFREFIHERMKGDDYVPANLSRNHPDYGMSMKDHLVEKAKRNSEKSS